MPPLARGFVLRASRPRLGFALAFGCTRRALSQHHSPSSHHHPDQHSPPECPFKPKNRTEDGEDVIVPYCLSSSRYSIFKFASFSSCFVPAGLVALTTACDRRLRRCCGYQISARIAHLCRCIRHCRLIRALSSALRQRRQGLDRHDLADFGAEELARACQVFGDSQSQNARGLRPGRYSAVQIAAICLVIGPKRYRWGTGGTPEIAFSAINRPS